MAKRNRIKRVIAGLTALLIVSAPLPLQEMGLSDFSFGITASADGNECGSGVKYSLDGGTLTISKTGTGGTDNGAMTNYDNSNNKAPWNENAASITSVVIGEGITSIGAYAFDGCTGLTSVTIASSVTSIGENAFSGCSTLATVEFKATSPITTKVDFLGGDNVTTIKVPAASYSTYKLSLRAYKTKLVPDFDSATINAVKNTDLTFIGSPQSLIGTVPNPATSLKFVYSSTEDGEYGNGDALKQTDAGTYDVWYKIVDDTDDDCYKSSATNVQVTIGQYEVSTIAITDIDTPVPGESLDTQAADIVENAGYTIESVSWKDSSEQTVETADYEGTYTVSVVVALTNANYKFAGSPIITINGYTPTSSPLINGKYTVTYTFEATKKNPISAFNDNSVYYDGNAKEFSVTKAEDYEDSISYEYFTDAECTNQTTADTDGAESDGKAPTNAGEYWVKATAPANGDFAAATATAKLTISKATPTVSNSAAVSSQKIVKGVGKFVEPTFGGVTSEENLNGSITYTYGGTDYDYDGLVNVLKNAETGGTITYKFVPNDTKNYNTFENGSIAFTMVDIELKDSSSNKVTKAADIVTIKDDATYGDTWASIVSVKDGLTANVGDVAGTGTFSIDKTGSPDAGDNQTYHVLFSGTIDGISYTNVPVFEGTVNVAPKSVEVTVTVDGTYTYDGNAQEPAADSITVKYTGDSEQTVPSTEYDVTYGENINAGEDAGSVIVSAKENGNYTFSNATDGKVTKTFDIAKATPDKNLFDFTAPTGDALKYTGNAIEPTVTLKDDVTLPEGSYSIKYSTSEGGDLTATPVNVGTYYVYAEIKGDANYADTNVLLGNYTIAKATPVLIDSTVATQNIFNSTGTFAAPAFKGVDGTNLEGTVTYSYNSVTKTVEELTQILQALYVGATGEITYTFTHNDNTNYETISNGKISFTMVDILFKTGDTTITSDTPAADVVTIKTNPTYGDTWEQIVTINSGLKAYGDSGEIVGTFTLNQTLTDKPNAADNIEYQVLFNSTDVNVENKVVYTGTVNVEPKTVTVSAGTYKVSKEYDETTGAGTGSGNLAVSGIVSGDEGNVTANAGTIGKYSSSDAGNDYEVEVEISLDGTAKGNYTLGDVTSIKVPAEITKATQSAPSVPTVSTHDCHSVTLTPDAAYQFSMDGENWQDSNVFTGLTDGETYNFYQRLKGTDNYNASAASEPLNYQFNAAEHEYTAQTVKSAALYKSATCTSAAKYYYSCSVCGDVEKDSTHTFTSGSYASHSYVTVSGTAKAATCGTAGKSADKRCSVCGKTVTGAAIPATGKHDYSSGGICKVCEGLENGKDGFKSASLTLTDGVILNYYLLLSDTALADTNAYIHFTSAQGLDRKLMLSEGVVENGRYKFSLELRPDQMSDEITAQVIYSDSSKGNSINYSVQQYVSNVSESDTSAQKLKNLADAMLNFGAFTQLYTGNNTGDLATDVVDYAVNASIGDEYKHKLTSNISDITVKGATLQIGAYTTIRVKYQLAAGADINDFTFKCGNTVLEPEKSGDYYYVYLRNIRPQNLDEMYSFTVSDGKDTTTLEYSAFSYMKNILDNADKYDKNIVNLMNAMYDYNKAADAYNN